VNFDPSRIKGWRLYGVANGTNVTVNKISLINRRASFDGIIDEFGQWADLNWSGKLTSFDQLSERAALETSDLATAPKLAQDNGISDWGKARATGAWRVERSPRGVWTLVKPDGNRFWSVGSQVVSDNASVAIEGRENMFTNLPAQNDAAPGTYL
jgi:hypothetical protein